MSRYIVVVLLCVLWGAEGKNCRGEEARERACENLCDEKGNCTVRAALLLPRNTSYDASLTMVESTLELALQQEAIQQAFPDWVQFEWMSYDVEDCDAAYAVIGAIDAYNDCAHVFFGPSCDFALEIESEHLDLNSVGQHYYKNQVTKGKKVDVKVYYESLCPGCEEFHTTDLNDTYAKIGSYMDVKTYPYGNARRKRGFGKTVIECQHGPEECYGNKLHACAIDILNNVSRSLYYVSCMMKAYWGGEGSTDIDATKCGQLMDIDAKPIIECANGKKGEDLLEYYGKETEKLEGKMYVPWILINGKLYDLRNQTQGFMVSVCKALDNPPPECRSMI